MLTDKQVARMNYGSGPYKPTPAQQRVLDRFTTLGARQLPARPSFWSPGDKVALQALVRRGYVRVLVGPGHVSSYVRTYKSLS